MNAAAAPAPADGDDLAAHATEDVDQAEAVAPPTSKRNTAEDLGLVCLGALLLAAARGALDLGLAAEARMTLSVAACCAVLAGAIFLFRDASGRFVRGCRRRREQQRPTPETAAGAVRRKIVERPGEEQQQPSSASDRLSRSPSSDVVGPHGAATTTTHEQQAAQEPVTPEPAAFRRATSSGATAYKQQPAGAEKPTTPEPKPRRTSRPRKPSRRYSSGDWEL